MAERDEILGTLQTRGFGAREEFFSFEEVETLRIDLKRAPHRIVINDEVNPEDFAIFRDAYMVWRTFGERTSR